MQRKKIIQGEKLAANGTNYGRLVSEKRGMPDMLRIKNARVHNLKSVSIDIPKNSLVVFTGVSGSGKSSLVFDTIYAEGQRRYVESLSSYARQFLGIMDKPDVERIDGISPPIAIDQKSISRNPRSTVGTITEIYDYLRLLFARAGTPHCPNGHGPISKQTASQIKEQVARLRGDVYILAPLVRGKKGEHRTLLEMAAEGGFLRARIDRRLYSFDELAAVSIDPKKKHTIEVVVDHLTISKDESVDAIRLSDSVETALRVGKGIAIVAEITGKAKKKEIVFSEHFACTACGFSAAEIEPRTFSFNSPYGACSACSGLGTQMEVEAELAIPNKNLTLAEGAIRPWMTASHRLGRQSWFWYLMQGIANKYHFSLTIPVKDLPKEAIDIVMRGDDEYEGVVPNLKRRYKETDSDWTRAEIEKYMTIRPCPECGGKRLNPVALSVLIGGKSIYDISQESISAEKEWFSFILDDNSVFDAEKRKIASPVMKEIISRLQFLERVGLAYLSISRSSSSLSGGEAQRIRLATQLGSFLSGVLYILDEPSIGLHSKDQQKLIETMKELRDLGNSVLVVEHDALTIRQADWVVDVGPFAGKYGGKITFEGTPAQLMKSRTLTGEYLSGRKNVDIAPFRGNADARGRVKGQKYLKIKGATEHNLKNIEVKIPLGKFVCVTGVSGSGKSTLVNDILAKELLRKFHRAHTIPGAHKKIEGIQNLNKAIVIDQSPIGRTPRSNPATYTGAFTIIRELFARTRDARVRGYSAGRFSFNVKGGRCESCQGAGLKKVEMFFMPDLYVECDECRGKRYTAEALEIQYKGKTISDVLEMTVGEAVDFFKPIPSLFDKLDVLRKVGLGYAELGQPAPALSGGEAQRIKLATELARRDTGRTMYILDEPTTGLHFDDTQKLLEVLIELVGRGNSVLVIEHNLDVIRNADWIIDLGPEGGDEGGYVVAEGTPKQISAIKSSFTGQYLRGGNF